MAEVRGQVEGVGLASQMEPSRWPPACCGSRLLVRPRGFRPAQELLFFGWEEISVTSFSEALGWGSSKPRTWWVTPTHPAPFTGKACPLVREGFVFEVKCCITGRNGKYEKTMGASKVQARARKFRKEEGGSLEWRPQAVRISWAPTPCILGCLHLQD